VAEELRTTAHGESLHWPLPAQEDEPACRLPLPTPFPLRGWTEDICGPSPSLVAESTGRISAGSRKPQDSGFFEQVPLRDSNGRCSSASIKQRSSTENLMPQVRNPSPLQDSNGRCSGTWAKPQRSPDRNQPQVFFTGRQEDFIRHEACLRHREELVAEREDQITSREAEIFEKELEQSAHAKLLKSLNAANQEKEAELRNRQELIEQAELQARVAEQDQESKRDAVCEAHAVAGLMMAEAKEAELRVQEQILEEKENQQACAPSPQRASQCGRRCVGGGIRHELDLNMMPAEYGLKAYPTEGAPRMSNAQGAPRMSNVQAHSEERRFREDITALRGLLLTARQEAHQECSHSQKATNRLEELEMQFQASIERAERVLRLNEEGGPEQTRDIDQLRREVQAMPGHLEETRQHCSQKLAEKREALARWEQALRVREQALEEEQWRPAVDRIAPPMEASFASNSTFDTSGGSRVSPMTQSPGPSAWGPHQRWAPTTSASTSWLGRLTACGCRTRRRSAQPRAW